MIIHEFKISSKYLQFWERDKLIDDKYAWLLSRIYKFERQNIRILLLWGHYNIFQVIKIII